MTPLGLRARVNPVTTKCKSRRATCTRAARPNAVKLLREVDLVEGQEQRLLASVFRRRGNHFPRGVYRDNTITPSQERQGISTRSAARIQNGSALRDLPKKGNIQRAHRQP